MTVNMAQTFDPDGRQMMWGSPSVYLDEHLEIWDPRGAENLYCFAGSLTPALGKTAVQHVLLQLVDAESGTYSRIGCSIISCSPEETSAWCRGCSWEEDYPCMLSLNQVRIPPSAICIIHGLTPSQPSAGGQSGSRLVQTKILSSCHNRRKEGVRRQQPAGNTETRREITVHREPIR